MDPSVKLSDETLGEIMLDSARLGKVEKLLVLSSTGNDTGFDRIGQAMMDQHSALHKEEKRGDAKAGKFQNNGQSGRRPFFGKKAISNVEAQQRRQNGSPFDCVAINCDANAPEESRCRESSRGISSTVPHTPQQTLWCRGHHGRSKYRSKY